MEDLAWFVTLLLIIFPVVSLIIGIILGFFIPKWRYYVLIIPVLFPVTLLHQEAIIDQVQIWLVYGVVYALICLVAMLITTALKKRFSK